MRVCDCVMVFSTETVITRFSAQGIDIFFPFTDNAVALSDHT